MKRHPEGTRRIAIIVGLVLAMAVGLGGCTTISPPPASNPKAIERPPASPSNLSAKAVSQDTVKLQWVDNSGNEDGFRIYRDNKLVATVGPNTRAYQLAGLEPATTYQYVVKAYNQAGESPSPVCTVRTPNPPAPTIDDIFLSRWGHPYYNNAPRVSYNGFDIDKLLIQISLQIPWQLCYESGVFDCSEMTAYLEYVLERHGYTAEICQGEVILEHAWVLVYNDVARCWIPIEATSPTGSLEPVLFHILTLGVVKDHYTPRWRWDDIYHVTRVSEYDWWNSPYAARLVEASDRAKLAEPLPPLPMPKPSLLPNVTIESVGLPAEIEVGKIYDYLIALRNNESRSVTVTLKIHSSVTGEVSSKSVTIPANVTKHVTDRIKFQPAGVRTMTYTILYNGQEVDSLSKTVEAK